MQRTALLAATQVGLRTCHCMQSESSCGIYAHTPDFQSTGKDNYARSILSWWTGEQHLYAVDWTCLSLVNVSSSSSPSLSPFLSPSRPPSPLLFPSLPPPSLHSPSQSTTFLTPHLSLPSYFLSLLPPFLLPCHFVFFLFSISSLIHLPPSHHSMGQQSIIHCTMGRGKVVVAFLTTDMETVGREGRDTDDD